MDMEEVAPSLPSFLLSCLFGSPPPCAVLGSPACSAAGPLGGEVSGPEGACPPPLAGGWFEAGGGLVFGPLVPFAAAGGGLVFAPLLPFAAAAEPAAPPLPSFLLSC